MCQALRKMWYILMSFGLLLFLPSCKFPDFHQINIDQQDAQALQEVADNDPCKYVFDSEGVSGISVENEFALVVHEDAFNGDWQWQEFIDQNDLEAEKSEQGWLIFLPGNADADFSNSLVVYVHIPDCDKPANDSAATLADDASTTGDDTSSAEDSTTTAENAGEIEEGCSWTLTPPPPGLVIQPDEKTMELLFLPRFSVAGINPFTMDEIVDIFGEREYETISPEPEMGEWYVASFSAGTTFEKAPDGSLIVTSPTCGENILQVLMPPFEEIAAKACQIYTSPLPEGSIVEDCGHGRTCVYFPRDNIPPDWMDPAYPGWWTPVESSTEPGVYHALLAPGASIDPVADNPTLLMPFCFPNHRAMIKPSADGDIVNTGLLPEDVGVHQDFSGYLAINLPEPNAVGDWELLRELGARLDVFSNETGSYKVVFPRGSTLEPKENGTFDIILGDGQPPTKAEYMGWAWVDNCTLLLGPRTPEHLQTTSDSLGNLSMLVSAGPEADAWTAAAEKDGRIGIFLQDSGETEFVFNLGSTLEYLDDGTIQIKLAKCTPE